MAVYEPLKGNKLTALRYSAATCHQCNERKSDVLVELQVGPKKTAISFKYCYHCLAYIGRCFLDMEKELSDVV